MRHELPASLSDHDLLIETQRAAASERLATTTLLALLAEIDLRKLYLGEGFSSLFGYATQRLHLSEPAAYSRITAARAARRFPIMLRLLSDGAISLTTVSLLAAHLTDENHAELLDAARHKSKRDVERLVAALYPQPDVATSVRALPITRATVIQSPLPSCNGDAQTAPPVEPARIACQAASTSATQAPLAAARRPTLVAPIAPRRYLIRMTVSEETHEKLQRARDLLRHVIPDGDPAAIVDRALTVLLQQAERSKIGAVGRPRATKPRAPRTDIATRHVPAAIRRAVWARDEGRCAFLGSMGRCQESGGLEFHHVVPFAVGGPTTADNLQLRCRPHNAFEGERWFGDWRGKTGAKNGRRRGNSVRTELSGAPRIAITTRA